MAFEMIAARLVPQAFHGSACELSLFLLRDSNENYLNQLCAYLGLLEQYANTP